MTPVLLVSVYPSVCFVISASEEGATPFLGDHQATSKSASAGGCDVVPYISVVYHAVS